MNGFQGVIKGKCPRCREGDMFEHSALNYRRFNKMHEHCPCCGLHYTVEPGFFIGAMYVSYAIVVAIVFVVDFILLLTIDPGLWAYGIISSLCVLLLLPFIFRYSRILYLYWFGGITYKPLTNSKNC